MTQTSVMPHSATGWKAIAKMIDVSVRTAKTYYKKLDLPVKHNRAGKPVLLYEDYSTWINTK